LAELLKVISSTSQISIAVNNSYLIIKDDPDIVMVRLLEGKFPNYHSAMSVQSYDKIEFDRSKYNVPEVGEIVVVKKDFYYDGSFRKFINQSDPSQKPNWRKISKGTELIILNVEETDGDWKIRFIDNSPSKGDISLYYIDTKDYWNTKSNIRNKKLKKLGI
jgi:hypothetical protein